MSERSTIDVLFEAYLQYSPFAYYPLEIMMISVIFFYIVQFFIGKDLNNQIAGQLAVPLVKELKDMGFKQNPAFNTFTIDTITLKLPTVKHEDEPKTTTKIIAPIVEEQQDNNKKNDDDSGDNNKDQSVSADQPTDQINPDDLTFDDISSVSSIDDDELDIVDNNKDDDKNNNNSNPYEFNKKPTAISSASGSFDAAMLDGEIGALGEQYDNTTENIAALREVKKFEKMQKKLDAKKLAMKKALGLLDSEGKEIKKDIKKGNNNNKNGDTDLFTLLDTEALKQDAYKPVKYVMQNYVWQESHSAYHITATEHPTLLAVHCAIDTIHRHDLLLQLMGLFGLTHNHDSFTIQFAFRSLPPMFFNIAYDKDECQKLREDGIKGKSVDVQGVPLSSTVYKNTTDYLLLTDTIELLTEEQQKLGLSNDEKPITTTTLPKSPPTPFSTTTLDFLTGLQKDTNNVFTLRDLCCSDLAESLYHTVSFNDLHSKLADYKRESSRPNATMYDLPDEKVIKTEQTQLFTCTIEYNFLNLPLYDANGNKLTDNDDPNNQRYVNLWVQKIMVHLYMIVEQLLKYQLPQHALQRNLKMRREVEANMIVKAEKEQKKQEKKEEKEKKMKRD